NVFNGLLKNVREKDNYVITQHVSRGGRRAYALVPANANQGRASGVSFPFATFERGVLSLLKEVKREEILPPDDDGSEDETLGLSQELEAIKARIALAETEFDRSDEDEALIATRRIKALIARQKEVAGKLA